MEELFKGEKVELMITEDQIQARIKELAEEINRDLGDMPITLLCTLTGSLFFAADLARQLGPNVYIDFVKAASYGNRTESHGEVQLDYFPGSKLSGRHVLLVEDIIDTGHTMKKLRKHITAEGPLSLKICSLLDKPERRKIEGITINYLGFTIPDKFVVGYGLDYSEKYRNLPYIGVLHFDKEVTV